MDLRIYTAYKLQKDKTIVYQQLKRYTLDDYINYLHDNDDEYDEENDDFEEYNYTDDFFDEDIFEITTKIPDFAQYNYYFVTGNVNLSTINSILTELYKFLKGYSVDYCYYETKEDASLYITEKNLITDSIYWTYEETCIKKEKTAFIGLLNKYNFFMEETPYSVSGFYRSFPKNEDNENIMSFCEYLKSLDSGNILNKYIQHTRRDNNYLIIKDSNVSLMNGDLPYNFSDFISLQ